MAQTTTPSEVLDEVVDRLVNGLHPERIYLFGSQARGEAGKGSDLDLLVVVPESDLPRHKREAQSYDLLWGIKQPVDVIILTREEFDRTSRVKTSLASTARSEGKVVYG